MIIEKNTGWWCTECKTLCRSEDQGLSCNCDPLWMVTVIPEGEYPQKWVEVEVTIREKK